MATPRAFVAIEIATFVPGSLADDTSFAIRALVTQRSRDIKLLFTVKLNTGHGRVIRVAAWLARLIAEAVASGRDKRQAVPMIRFATILAIAICLATPGHAAKLVVAEGEVLVSQGKGFKPGVVGQELHVGDRVMIGRKGGEAVIDYEDQCIERVWADKPGKVNNRIAVVGRISPCSAGAPTVSGVLPNDFGLVAGVVGAAVIAGPILYGATQRPSSP